MKKISAIIRPFKLDEVRAALMRAGAEGMTIIEAMGFSRCDGRTGTDAGGEYAGGPVPGIKIEVVVADSRVESLIEAVRVSAATGRGDDGTILISCVDRAVRIRTGEVDAAAL